MAYADDIAILVDDEATLKTALREMSKWERYGLKVNPAKSNVISDTETLVQAGFIEKPIEEEGKYAYKEICKQNWGGLERTSQYRFLGVMIYPSKKAIIHNISVMMKNMACRVKSQLKGSRCKDEVRRLIV